MAQVRKNPVPSSLTQSLAGLLAGCWLEGLPQFLSMRVFPLDSSQHSSKKRQREQEKACKMEAGVSLSPNLRSDILSLLWQIQFTRPSPSGRQGNYIRA